jgi:putative transposase
MTEVTRCHTCQLKVSANSQKHKALRDATLSSKNVYNSALYCQRKYYSLVQILHQYVVEHFNDYKESLSTNDVKCLFKYCIRNRLLSEAQLVFSVHGSKDMIESIKDEELRSHFQVNKSRRKGGRSQTASEIIRVFDHLKNTSHFEQVLSNKTDNERHQIKEYVIALQNVLAAKSESQQNTVTRKRDNMTENEKEIADSKKKKLANVLPPVYLSEHFLDLYVKQNIPSYQDIGSQVAQQTIRKLDKAYESFFERVKLGQTGACPPKYNTTQAYNLVFQNNSFKQGKDHIRLSMGKTYKELAKTSSIEPYLYFKMSKKLLLKIKVTEIEIVPSQYIGRSDKYTLVLKYDKIVPEAIVEDKLKCKASIDLGQTNVVTMFSPALTSPIIFKGNQVVRINRTCNYLVDTIKQQVKHTWKTNTCRNIQDILSYRANKISDYFHKVSNNIIQICKKNCITELILGYNTNWKCRVNMGATNNRTFYEIPYRKLTHMLFYKGEESGIKVVENEESYTSKCDSLSLEPVSKQETYLGRRVKRGLFQSSQGVLLNADVNGAINIMRKYIYKAHITLSSTLDSFILNLPWSAVCNPKVCGKIATDVLQQNQGAIGSVTPPNRIEANVLLA